jgi:hypothetical protein
MHTQQVPDGALHLWLYQTEALAEVIDESVIATTFRIKDESTIPRRDDSISDYFYGASCMYVRMLCMHVCMYVCIYE